MLLDRRLGARWWTPLTNVSFTSPADAALNCPRPVIMNGIGGLAQAVGALGQPPPPPGGHLLLPTSFLQNSLHIAMDTRGPAIDAFNSGGGCCRKSQQQPPGGLPSTSSTSVVAAVGLAASGNCSPPLGRRCGVMQSDVSLSLCQWELLTSPWLD
jgi:hypothetical protein